MAAGYLTLKEAERWKLVKSQSGLLTKNGSVWGRRLALRLYGLPVTQFEGLGLWHCWSRLPLQEKLGSMLGTLRRIVTRRLYRPLRLGLQEAVVLNPAASDLEHNSPARNRFGPEELDSSSVLRNESHGSGILTGCTESDLVEAPPDL
jgi:hypothetical protein